MHCNLCAIHFTGAHCSGRKVRRSSAALGGGTAIALTRSGADGSVLACQSKYSASQLSARCSSRRGSGGLAASPRLPSPDSRLPTPSSRLRPRPPHSAGEGRKQAEDVGQAVIWLATRASGPAPPRCGPRSTPRRSSSLRMCWWCRSAPLSPFPTTTRSTTTSSLSRRRTRSTWGSTAGGRPSRSSSAGRRRPDLLQRASRR